MVAARTCIQGGGMVLWRSYDLLSYNHCIMKNTQNVMLHVGGALRCVLMSPPRHKVYKIPGLAFLHHQAHRFTHHMSWSPGRAPA